MATDERLAVFRALRPLLARYVPPLEARTDVEGRYDVWSPTPVEVEGRRRRDVFFAGLIIQSSYVGLYYMPIYADGETRSEMGPELLELLKGKSCFHIRRLDDVLTAQVDAAVTAGFDRWVARGWIVP